MTFTRFSFFAIGILCSYFSFAQTLLADIAPGPGAAHPTYYEMVSNQNLLFFTKEDATGDMELYTSDGTQGSYTKIDINPTGSSNPRNLQVIGAWVYFFANDGNNGQELHRSNGTTTEMLETESGADGILPYEMSSLIEVNNDLYFVANTSLNGTELWKISAGSSSPQLIEYQSGTAGVDMSYMQNDNWDFFHELVYEPTTNALYWTAFAGQGIWKYGLGNSAPQKLPGSVTIERKYPLVPFAGKLYFNATDPTNFDPELWVCDGSSIQLAYDLVTGAGNNYSYPYFFSPIGNRLYFTAFNPNVSDWAVAYLEENAGSITQHWDASFSGEWLSTVSNRHPFSYDNGALHFRYGNTVYQLDNAYNWQVDHHFIQEPLASKNYVFLNGKYYYSGVDSTRFQLFSHDGTMNGEAQVSNFVGDCDCPLGPFALLNGNAYFFAYDQTVGMEVFMLFPTTSQKESQKIQAKIQVFPNPTTDFIQIDCSGDLGAFQVQVYDAAGVLLKSQMETGNTARVHLENLPQGVLYLKIEEAKTGKTKSFKVMKM